MAINQIEEFGTMIGELGVEYNSRTVAEWGQRLNRQARMLHFAAMKETLQGYPQLIADVLSRGSL